MKGMTIIVKSISSWVKMLVLLFGIYVTIFGHLTPGGGFAGGVILAGSYILLMLAFGREYVEENLSLGITSKLDCVGCCCLRLSHCRAFSTARRRSSTILFIRRYRRVRLKR